MDWSRRHALAGIGAVTGVGLGLLFRTTRSKGWETCLLRPPGALAEPDFLAACIRCGQCVEACPFGTLHLAVGLAAEIANGTPYVDPRTVPCYLCQGYDTLRCIASCPTTALETVPDPRDVRMGTATIDESTCLPYKGVACRVCWHACPFPNEAIRFDPLLRPVVDKDHCVGCGLCDYACPTEPSSIPVQPPCGAASASVRADFTESMP